jgi:hypothetical protein
MSTSYTLELELLSDTTPGRGEGVAGLVDAEVQHDELGLPVISGRALKGLLVNECAIILRALGQTHGGEWHDAARALFGERGETDDAAAGLSIGPATLAPDLIAQLRGESETKRPAPEKILSSLTAIRRQTRINEHGAPKDQTLRATRVILRGLTFYAPLLFEQEPIDQQRELLAACVLAVRRLGTGRNRGKGRVKARLTDRDLEPTRFAATEQARDLSTEWLAHFEQEVLA